MSCKIYKHKDFLTTLLQLKKDKKKLAQFFKNSKPSEINSICEVAFNILNGGVRCTPYRKNRLRKHATILRLLADKKISVKTKKAKLLSGSGFLLSSLIPLAIGAITQLFNRR